MGSSPERLEDQLPPLQDATRSSTRRSLLPAFEPLSSSPNPARASKRKHDSSPRKTQPDLRHYPTPVPTSSTGIVPSSPPQARPSTRPGLLRTTSSVSERVPLGTLPSVDLPLDGEPVLMGRSSNSSHFQLSNCRLISRVHVRASYRVADESHEYGQVLIECLGWNGAKIHCQGKAHELGKGDTFSSDRPWAEIMLDVQDARVLLRWPDAQRKVSQFATSDAATDTEQSPLRVATPANEHIASSPPMPHVFLHSPVSPSPRDRNQFTASSTFLGLPSASSPSPAAVEVYEDSPSEEEQAPVPQESVPASPTPNSKPESQPSSLLSEVQDYSDHDEENDPIVHSFGPFGDNLLPRIASMHATTPDRHRKPLRASISPQQRTSSESTYKLDTSPIRNHVINQLAFSRLHSVPLSTIMNNLPATLKGTTSSPSHTENKTNQLTIEELKSLLDNIACVGEISRNGKDAAGKPLENEFYYVPEMDADEMRRSAVENSLGKSSLRAVRKQHKQYYWKRPRH